MEGHGQKDIDMAMASDNDSDSGMDHADKAQAQVQPKDEKLTKSFGRLALDRSENLALPGPSSGAESNGNNGQKGDGAGAVGRDKSEAGLPHGKFGVGIKVYRCEKCNKVFGRQDVLKMHIQTHTPETPPVQTYKYKCPFCPRSFDHFKEYKQHSISHSAVQPVGNQRGSNRVTNSHTNRHTHCYPFDRLARYITRNRNINNDDADNNNNNNNNNNG